jgi:DNA repair protein RadC
VAGFPIQNGVVIIVTARDAADLLGPFFADRPGETLAVLHLDADQRLIALDTPASASADAIELPIREIFQAALHHGAAGIVLARNRPGGDPRPRPADIAALRRLAETAAALDIRLHDQLIFAAGECRSFRELGLL